MTTDRPPLLPALEAYVAAVGNEIATIPAERRVALQRLASFTADRRSVGESARLVFICTHNSRRSQMAQVWAATGAHWFDVTGVECYSGGTEATAFNSRAVAALRRAGLRVTSTGSGGNPISAVTYAANVAPLACFSKLYGSSPNPAAGFCAVMTCSSADQRCPVVFGASQRIPLPYEDPQAFDGSEDEVGAYDGCCRQIAREMLFVMGLVAAP